MVKKEVKMPKKRKDKKQSSDEILNLILENNVTIQKNLIETQEELKNLNIKLTQLLEIFDKAGRTFDESLEKGSNTDVVELEKKLSILIDQNRVLAKGLLLLERSVRPEQMSTVRKSVMSRGEETEESEGSEESEV